MRPLISLYTIESTHYVSLGFSSQEKHQNTCAIIIRFAFFLRSCMHALMDGRASVHPSIYIPIHSFIRSFTNPLIQSLTFLYPIVCPSICSFTKRARKNKRIIFHEFSSNTVTKVEMYLSKAEHVLLQCTKWNGRSQEVLCMRSLK